MFKKFMLTVAAVAAFAISTPQVAEAQTRAPRTNERCDTIEVVFNALRQNGFSPFLLGRDEGAALVASIWARPGFSSFIIVTSLDNDDGQACLSLISPANETIVDRDVIAQLFNSRPGQFN